MSGRTGGAGDAGAPRPRGRASALSAEQRGSQALEFAMVLPAIVLLLVLLVHVGLLGADLVISQGVAREAARAAAVADDAAVRQTVTAALGARPVEVRVQPVSPRNPGDLVTARLRVRSRAFSAFGLEVWLPARATMRVEAQ